jgi:hypothetical protein
LGVSAAVIDSELRFLNFMVRREALRLKKESGAPWPWSSDPILNAFKFTNVKREDDRTTRWMRTNWTGPNSWAPAGEIIFNCGLFRYFGVPETAQAIEWQTLWNPRLAIRRVEALLGAGRRIFTGAYIIPTLGRREMKHTVVCNYILTPLWEHRSQLASIAERTASWRQVAEALMLLPGFGGTGFMAKELLQDAMQTPVLAAAVDRNTWCPAGPGARRGLNRVYSRQTSQQVKFDKLLSEMKHLLGLAQVSMPEWMPSLELHDIQFQLCEFDKYERTRLGEGTPKARYVTPNIRSAQS